MFLLKVFGDWSKHLVCSGPLPDTLDCISAIITNVWRYVALPQSRGGACFCTRGAVQDYAVITLFSRWQKP